MFLHTPSLGGGRLPRFFPCRLFPSRATSSRAPASGRFSPHARDGEEDEGHQQQAERRHRLRHAKKKVGRKIKKSSNNATDTTVRAKRINLSTQTLGAEGKGDAVTSRGLSMPELLNQTTHYSERVRKDALEGIRELLQSHPESLVASAATVVEKVAERLVDQEQVVRTAARAALKSGLLPALGPHGLAPFARRLVLHVGAALTHVAPAVRRDAPRVLEALLDAAPHLVGAHAPAATLRHLADLLRRGDDAASSSLDAARAGAANAAAAAAVQRAGGLAASFGDFTASRVGAALRTRGSGSSNLAVDSSRFSPVEPSRNSWTVARTTCARTFAPPRGVGATKTTRRIEASRARRARRRVSRCTRTGARGRRSRPPAPPRTRSETRGRIARRRRCGATVARVFPRRRRSWRRCCFRRTTRTPRRSPTPAGPNSRAFEA